MPPWAGELALLPLPLGVGAEVAGVGVLTTGTAAVGGLAADEGFRPSDTEMPGTPGRPLVEGAWAATLPPIPRPCTARADDADGGAGSDVAAARCDPPRAPCCFDCPPRIGTPGR